MNLKLLSIAFTNSFINVKNMDKPACKDCKFFKYDSIYTDYNHGKCTQFSYKHLISGKLYFENVVTARYEHCGENATYYEELKATI